MAVTLKDCTLPPHDQWLATWRKDASQKIRAIYWRTRARFAETIMRICFRRRTRNRAEHIYCLERKVAAQAENIRSMQRQFEHKNLKMKALNILVACDGHCNRFYMDNPGDVTEDVVKLCEQNALRLRHWWDRGGQVAADRYRAKYENKIRSMRK